MSMTQTDRDREANPGARQSVLYVEDDDTNWEVAEFNLRKRFHMARANTDERAFAMLRSRPFDVILMDIELAGSTLNGIDITRVLRGTYGGVLPKYAEKVLLSTPIVFVTAYAARYDKRELLQAGGDDRITKPVNFTGLALVMARLLVRNV
jgi:CheY-like chemotaxis protein